MKSLICINSINAADFILKIISHSEYGIIIEDSYVIGITGCANNPFVFGFKEGSKLPPEAEEFCNEKFHEYFPDCKLLNKLY
jgi:hypothetical protein